jgi:hypothetical protein
MLLVQIQPHPVQKRVLTRIEAQQSIRTLLDNLCSRWRSVSARTKIKKFLPEFFSTFNCLTSLI